MRSDYTDEQLDAIEKLTDSAAYAQGAGWQDNGEWERIVCELHDIVKNKATRNLADAIAGGEPIYMQSSYPSLQSIKDFIHSGVADEYAYVREIPPQPPGPYEIRTEYTMGAPSPLRSMDGAHTFIGDPSAMQKRATENIREFLTTIGEQIADGVADGLTESPQTNRLIDGRQLGRFRVSLLALEYMLSEAVLSAMSNFLIVRAETLYHMNAIEYVAYSDLFEPVEEGCEPPLYLVEIDSDGDVNATKRLNS